MEPNSLPVNAGTGDNGAYTCTNNAQYQNTMQDFVSEVIEESIAEKFDMKSQLAASNGTIRIADLGCSLGQNSLIAVQIVVEAMERKFKFIMSTQQQQEAELVAPEFHVFFNDLSSNDFNTLFTSLPPDRRYFAAGVPGSFFHGRLFPKSSLDFVVSTYSVTYLSKVPEEVLVVGGGDKQLQSVGIRSTSTISYSNASKQVADAYAAQFAEDMGVFFSARADEIAVGGMMIIMTSAAIPEGPHRSQHPGRLSIWCLEQSLIDMVQLGLITEAKLDSFKLPFYAVSLDEMRKLVERNGCFGIERMELVRTRSKIDVPLSLHDVTMGFRCGFEGILIAHFGAEINIDELFERMLRKATEVYPELVSSYKNTADLLLILKRM